MSVLGSITWPSGPMMTVLAPMVVPPWSLVSVLTPPMTVEPVIGNVLPITVVPLEPMKLPLPSLPMIMGVVVVVTGT